MKLTRGQVEARMTKAWGERAYTVPYYTAGHIYRWAVRNESHWMPLVSSWDGGMQVFEPAGNDTFPELGSDHDRWVEAVAQARQLASDYFSEPRNGPALKRLPRAVVIAEGQNWQCTGDEEDTWLMASQSRGGATYQVNGSCTCPDYRRNRVPGGWCKHRQARALAKRALQILEEEEGAGGGDSTPAPDGSPHGGNGHEQHSTVPFTGQAKQIDLTLAYEANEVNNMAHMNANGELIRFMADGQEVTPPVPTTRELYNWLQSEGYVPGHFQWLAWERGLRQRRQTYIRSEDRDAALPEQYSRGRSKLFKQ